MRQSQVQLKEYCFTNTRVELSPNFKRSKKYLLEAEHVDCSLNTCYSQKDDSYLIELAIMIDSTKFPKANLPYNVIISAFGRVSISPDYNGDKELLAVVNGASLLYSSIREYLLFITSRYPLGTLFLPTVNFQGMRKK